MANNYTENYGFCQWEATDQVLREEFNKDNAKVDEVLKETADVALAAQALAQAAYSPENSPFVVGSYTGDGTAKRKIELGFTPKAVLVVHYDGSMTYSRSSTACYGALALQGKTANFRNNDLVNWIDGDTIMMIVPNGFQVAFFQSGGFECYVNAQNHVLYYIAIK